MTSALTLKTSRRRITTEMFIERSMKTHKHRYDYSKSEYITAKEKVIIICKKHGEFKISPDRHSRGAGCQKCSKSSIKSISDFIDRFNLVHNYKYDYRESVYIGCDHEIEIRCKIHGIFKRKAKHHLQGRGCNECSKYDFLNEKAALFEKKAKLIHGDKYNYDLNSYKGSTSKVKITCLVHGEFEQAANKHLLGHNGCHTCLGYNKDGFILKATKIHGDIYVYDKVKYIKRKEKVIVVCKKHGDFLCRPDHHLRGVGCPVCRESKGEREVRSFLTRKNILFVAQKTWPDLIDKRKLKVDFFLPEMNTVIEYDGEQHYLATSFGGKNKKEIIKRFKKIQHKDSLKNCFFKKKEIKLIRIRFDENVDEILTNFIYT